MHARSQVVSEWDSVLDQLTARMFDCDITLTEGGKKKAAVKADVLTAPQPTIVFQQNVCHELCCGVVDMSRSCTHAGR